MNSILGIVSFRKQRSLSTDESYYRTPPVARLKQQNPGGLGGSLVVATENTFLKEHSNGKTTKNTSKATHINTDNLSIMLQETLPSLRRSCMMMRLHMMDPEWRWSSIACWDLHAEWKSVKLYIYIYIYLKNKYIQIYIYRWCFRKPCQASDVHDDELHMMDPEWRGSPIACWDLHAGACFY